MGTRADDDWRRREHERLNRDPLLGLAQERTKQRLADARRSRLYSFRMAGGRR